MSTNSLIKNLLSSKPYNHSITKLRLIETHVSWVILTGKYAYKIKKPVNFEFLDFSTLEKRKYYCEKELELGQQFASEIYLAVVPITGTCEHPQINGTGFILEYAIKMREFPQENLLSMLLKQGGLTECLIEQLGELIAEFHTKTPVAPLKSHFGLPQEIHTPTRQNFKQIAALLPNSMDIKQLQHLELWADRQYEHLHNLLQERKEQGFIRNCHGDLHLANIVLYKNKLVLFDRLEFNEALRWTDVIADLAFLVMDLAEKKQVNLANHLVNTYLYHTGDYQGLNLLPYYLAYRAIVRAKIAVFRLKQDGLSPEEKKEIRRDYHSFINLAVSYTATPKPCLIITHGFAGSGKTTIAKNIVKCCGAIQISSDVVRKRLFNLSLYSRSNSPVNEGIYTAQATQKTYKKLSEITETVMKAGFTALVDASFLQHSQRAIFYTLAKRLKAPFYILHCQTHDFEIRQRIENRLKHPNNISEADLSILIEQKKNIEPLTNLEKTHTLIIQDKQTPLKNILKTIYPCTRFETLS
jgi:uncharacterized protein